MSDNFDLEKTHNVDLSRQCLHVGSTVFLRLSFNSAVVKTHFLAHEEKNMIQSGANMAQFESHEFQLHQQTPRLIFDYYHYYIPIVFLFLLRSF